MAVKVSRYEIVLTMHCSHRAEKIMEGQNGFVPSILDSFHHSQRNSTLYVGKQVYHLPTHTYIQPSSSAHIVGVSLVRSSMKFYHFQVPTCSKKLLPWPQPPDPQTRQISRPLHPHPFPLPKNPSILKKPGGYKSLPQLSQLLLALHGPANGILVFQGDGIIVMS